MPASIIYVRFAYTPEGASEPTEDWRNVLSNDADTRSAVTKFLTQFATEMPGVQPRIITTEYKLDVHIV